MDKSKLMTINSSHEMAEAAVERGQLSHALEQLREAKNAASVMQAELLSQNNDMALKHSLEMQVWMICFFDSYLTKIFEVSYQNRIHTHLYTIRHCSIVRPACYEGADD